MKHGSQRLWGVLLAIVAGTLVAACSTPKPERFHSLLASELAAPQAAAGAAAPGFVDVLPVTVPPLVDQPQWVLRAADDSLQVLEQERWAAPLREELRSALLERLVSRWAAVDVRTLPQPTANVWRVRVDVQRFESLPSREARIESIWSLLPPQSNATALVCRSSVRESVAEAGVLALAAAHRRAVARLADDIGKRLVALQRGERAVCGD
jgi:uncharacterized lipoprotein YmbA